MRLLWVENHAVFVQVAGQQFLGAHQVTVVATLAEARKLLSEQAFDAILLDHDLDDGKGPELLPFIAALPCRPVVVAASALQAGNEALLRAGADDVCAKPRFSEIETVLARVSRRGTTKED
jgi:CheY-like chemotaxis protein